MPIYEYECPKCCNVFEVFQRMTEDPLTSCPDCSGPVKKLVSRSSFQLKGGGWYADGYTCKPSNGNGSKDKKDKKPETSTKKESTPSSTSDSSAGSKDKAGAAASTATS
jgi:putative FmdB family regulatory protein